MSPASLQGLHPRNLHPSAPWAFNLSVVDLLVAFPVTNLPSLEFGQQCTYYPQWGREPCFPMTHLGEDMTNEIYRETSTMLKGKIQVLWNSSCLPSFIRSYTWQHDAWSCSSQHVTRGPQAGWWKPLCWGERWTVSAKSLDLLKPALQPIH